MDDTLDDKKEIWDIIQLAKELMDVVGEEIVSKVTPEDLHEIVLFHSKGAAV